VRTQRGEQQHQPGGAVVLRDLLHRDGQRQRPRIRPADLGRQRDAQQIRLLEGLEVVLGILGGAIDLGRAGGDHLLRDAAGALLDQAMLFAELKVHDGEYSVPVAWFALVRVRDYDRRGS
jgi:hypothetical protein